MHTDTQHTNEVLQSTRQIYLWTGQLQDWVLQIVPAREADSFAILPHEQTCPSAT